jgi:hypothetical protein
MLPVGSPTECIASASDGSQKINQPINQHDITCKIDFLEFVGCLPLKLFFCHQQGDCIPVSTMNKQMTLIFSPAQYNG